MALYALGDMHLAFSVDKPMDKFGRVWRKHEQKIEKNCGRMIQERDTFVITGDHSWGKNRAEASRDLDFIAALPGKKILLRGNHDMFWDAKKTARLNEEYAGRLFFLQDNFAVYGEYALVATLLGHMDLTDLPEFYEGLDDMYQEANYLQANLLYNEGQP